MLKSTVLLIIFSALAIFFQSELVSALQYLLLVYNKIASSLAVVFSNTATGRVIQQTVTLIVIPVVIGTVAAFLWFIIKRNEMPHLIAAVWVVWTILLVAVLSQPIAHHAMQRLH